MSTFDLPHARVDVERLLSERQWVQRLARSLVADPNQADDVAQESWLTALRHPPQHDANLKSWLSRLVRNTAAALRRSDTRRSEREHSATRPAVSGGSSEALERAELVRELVSAVLALDQARREALVLVYFEGLAPNVAADQLGVPHSTFRTHVRRGLAEVREKLERRRGREGWLAAITVLACRPETHVVGIMLMKMKLAAALVVIVAGFLIYRGWSTSSTTPIAPSPVVASEPLEEVEESAALTTVEPATRTVVAPVTTATKNEHVVEAKREAPALTPDKQAAASESLWGRITMDGVPATPSDLRIAFEGRDLKQETQLLARNAVPLVDAHTNAFHVLQPLAGSFLLTATANGTNTFTALFQRGQGDSATQLDLDLRTGFAVIVHAIDDASNRPLGELPVEIEYSLHVDTRADIQNARIFHPVVQKGRTDERGLATIGGVVAGHQITVRVLDAGDRKPVGVVELKLEADAPSPQHVMMRIKESKSSDVALWGTTDFAPATARAACTVMLAPKGPYNTPVSSGPLSETSWKINTNFRGPAKIWIQSGKERVSVIVECVVGDRDQGPIQIPKVITQPLVVRWKNAPMGWKMWWGQARGAASESTIATRDGETMLSVEPDQALTCKLDAPSGESMWISWKQAGADGSFAPVDFGSMEARPVSLRIEHPERLTIDPSRIDGDVILETVDLSTDLHWRRIRLILKQGKASLPFRIDNQETFYRVNSPCVNACLAGMIPPAAASSSGALSLGQDYEWQALDQSRFSIQNSLIITGIGSRSLESVPVGLRSFEGRLILCAGNNPGSAPATSVLVPGQGAVLVFQP